MKFIFVRHGKTQFNELNLTQGWCDSPLSEIGEKQVYFTAEKLKSIPITKAFASPLGRAVQTAEIIMSHHSDVGLLQDARLKEMSYGLFEGISFDFVKSLHLESENCLEDLDMDYSKYKGETLKQAIHRYNSFFQDIVSECKKDDVILIVGHGCSLYGFLKTRIKKDIEFPMNAEAIVYDYSNEKWKLEVRIKPN